ncbi:vitamin B12 dependent methionine synthase [candidate division KSB1 bacterium]|nr:vitamin B12 dependent methionine synthase [candidate division KSB1 bacterium]
MPEIDFVLDKQAFLTKIRLERMPECRASAEKFIAEVVPSAKPKALLKLCQVKTSPPDIVWIDGIEFSSRILYQQVKHLNRVFPYVATCGRELHDYPVLANDFMERFWLDCLQEFALEIAVEHLHRYLAEKYAVEKFSSMNPGSATADVWPIEQQKQLFQLLGETQKLVGVELTPSYLMIPYKSVSGVFYETEKTFISCHLCPRVNCRQRRAAFRGESV